MWGKSAVKTVRSSDCVSQTEAKLHLKVDTTADNDLIDDLIDAAQDTVQNFTNRKLSSETWYYYLDEFPNGDIILPFSPVTSITSVKYYDTNNDQQTLTADTDYYIDIKDEPARIRDIEGWPGVYDRPDAVVVEYITGYSTGTNAIPLPLKQAVLVLIADMYENRVDTPRERFSTWKALANPYRVFHYSGENEP